MAKPDRITRRYFAAFARVVYGLRGQIPLDGEGGLPTDGKPLLNVVTDTIEEMIATGEAPQPGAEDEIIIRPGGKVEIGLQINRGWNCRRARNS